MTLVSSCSLRVALAVLGGIHYYLWIRLARDPQWPRAVEHGDLGWFFVAAAVGMPAAAILSRGRNHTACSAARVWPAFIWLGVMFLLVHGGVCCRTRVVCWWRSRGASRATAALTRERRTFIARIVGDGNCGGRVGRQRRRGAFRAAAGGRSQGSRAAGAPAARPPRADDRADHGSARRPDDRPRVRRGHRRPHQRARARHHRDHGRSGRRQRRATCATRSRRWPTCARATASSSLPAITNISRAPKRG